MTIYLDTSVVMSFFIRDNHADAVRTWAETSPDVTISDWTAAEFTSALSHYLRRGALSDVEREAIERAFDRWAAKRTVLHIERERFVEARTLMRSYRRLRAPDALHLAIARHADLTLATMDEDMRDAAITEGLEVVAL